MTSPHETAETPQALPDPFLLGIAERRLVVPRRRADGEVLHFAQRLPQDEVMWQDACGLARLYAYTVLWQAYRAEMPVPYNVAWVELDEGPRLISTVRTPDPESLAIGMRLVASFDAQGRLVFDPVASDGPGIPMEQR